jgi:group II intron reverse transcriptase/maturase
MKGSILLLDKNSIKARKRVPVVNSGIERVRQAAMRDERVKFTALFHHLTPELLKGCFNELNSEASPGVDLVTAEGYAIELESNILDLCQRLHSGTYNAQPSLRVYIPKTDGKMRPLGIAAVEDKIVQRAVVQILSVIYEVDFLDWSYGFRPGRHCHDALDKLYLDITQRKVSWILDADIKAFFDSISHDWMIRFLELRIADRRIIGLIKQWLEAGVIVKCNWESTETGCPQGGSASPLLANIYLHYVLDLWAKVFEEKARGEVHCVRYADDFVVGFQYKDDAVRFLEALRDRLNKFDLSLHPDKTRLIEFGRFAANNRRRRGEKKPETFNFLGFTHICSITFKKRMFKLLRITISKRMIAKLKSLYKELRKRINKSIEKVGKWLKRVLKGYYNYYAVHDNLRALSKFRYFLTKIWLKVIRRRSHRARMTWEKFALIVDKWLPLPEVKHLYPNQRLNVNN